jgi:hypothetical protein
VASHTFPPAAFQDPRIGKSSQVVIGFFVIRTLGVIYPGYDRSFPVDVDPHVLKSYCDGLKFGILDIGEELIGVADFASIFGIDERSEIRLRARRHPDVVEPGCTCFQAPESFPPEIPIAHVQFATLQT